MVEHFGWNFQESLQAFAESKTIFAGLVRFLVSMFAMTLAIESRVKKWDAVDTDPEVHCQK